MKPQERTIFILGGARSGKSTLAIEMAHAGDRERVLIATARASDVEMRARILRHQSDRPPGWRVVEAPLDIVNALETWRAADRVVVVDCLTLWLFNLMESGVDPRDPKKRLERELAVDRGTVILVSNEVGLGIVPATELGRRFRDEQGLLNQAIASACDRVLLVVAGIPLVLKPSDR